MSDQRPADKAPSYPQTGRPDSSSEEYMKMDKIAKMMERQVDVLRGEAEEEN